MKVSYTFAALSLFVGLVDNPICLLGCLLPLFWEA